MITYQVIITDLTIGKIIQVRICTILELHNIIEEINKYLESLICKDEFVISIKTI